MSSPEYDRCVGPNEASVKIVRVETFPITIPLVTPVKMSHVTIEESHNVLVRITTDEGLTGWGEGVEAMDLTGENQGRIRAGIEQLGAMLIGRDPLARAGLWNEMSDAVHGNATAIGAVDIALHDLAGKALGVPVSQLIGGANRTHIPVLTLLGSGDPEADLKTFQSRHGHGYRWFKLKLGIGDPAVEVETAEALTRAGADSVVCGDANGKWDEHTSLRFLRACADLGLAFVEQPTRHPSALLRVAAASPVPICADESAGSLADLVSLGPTAVAGVSLKLIKLGGITGVMRGAALCEVLGLNINLAGKVAESSVAAAANVHCAAAIHRLTYGCSPGNQGVAADVTRHPITVEDGSIEVPGGPGLGIEVDLDLVSAVATT